MILVDRGDTGQKTETPYGPICATVNWESSTRFSLLMQVVAFQTVL
jgi:hypothetical protein